MSGYLLGWLFGWFIGAILIAILAESRGRSVGGFFLVALLTSPLMAFIILLATPNLAAQESERQERERSESRASLECSRRVQGADIVIRFDKLRHLHEKGLLTPDEYAARKQKILNEIQDKRLVESAEEFLGLLIPLFESQALTADEFAKLKTFAFDGPQQAFSGRKKSDADDATRPCPNCDRPIHPKARTCMHCWAKVRPVS